MRTARTIALLTALAAACASSRAGRSYRDEQMDFGSVHTVAVMPLANFSQDSRAADRVRDVFAASLLATGGIYVLPAGEVVRGIKEANVATPETPSPEEAVKLGKLIKADAVITGVLKEYGEVRSGSTAANIVAVSFQMIETGTGKVIWSGASTKGGIGFKDRLFGGGGAPLNDITQAAIDDVIDKLFR